MIGKLGRRTLLKAGGTVERATDPGQLNNLATVSGHAKALDHHRQVRGDHCRTVRDPFARAIPGGDGR